PLQFATRPSRTTRSVSAPAASLHPSSSPPSLHPRSFLPGPRLHLSISHSLESRLIPRTILQHRDNWFPLLVAMVVLAKLGAPSTPGFMMDRRRVMLIPSITIGIGSCQYTFEKGVAKAEFADMPALRGKDYGKTKMRYPDYTETESGLQYKDLRVGDGPFPKRGETVVVDWDGYTIGYYGRIFEARNKTKGGSFEGGDKDFFKFKVGSGQVIPAFEEAISGMAPGGVRRIIVPPDLGYPDNDYSKDKELLILFYGIKD
ncbi:unnamed protein product, partial [Urochloa humidicola]